MVKITAQATQLLIAEAESLVVTVYACISSLSSIAQTMQNPSSFEAAPAELTHPPIPEMTPACKIHRALSLLKDKNVQGKSIDEQLSELAKYKLETAAFFPEPNGKALYELMNTIWKRIDSKLTPGKRFEQLVLMLKVMDIRLHSAAMEKALKEITGETNFLTRARQSQILAKIFSAIPDSIVKLLKNNKPDQESLATVGSVNHLNLLIPLQKDPAYIHAEWSVWKKAIKEVWQLEISDETARMLAIVSKTKTCVEQACWFNDIKNFTQLHTKLSTREDRPGMHWSQAWVLLYEMTGEIVPMCKIKRVMKKYECREDEWVSRLMRALSYPGRSSNNLDMLYQLKYSGNISSMSNLQLQRTFTLIGEPMSIEDIQLIDEAFKFRKEKRFNLEHIKLMEYDDNADIDVLAVDSLRRHAHVHNWQRSVALVILWLDHVYPPRSEDLIRYLEQAQQPG